MWICGLFLSIARNVDVFQAAAAAATAAKVVAEAYSKTKFNTNNVNNTHILGSPIRSQMIFFFGTHGPCTHSLAVQTICTGSARSYGITPHSYAATYSIDRTNYTQIENE